MGGIKVDTTKPSRLDHLLVKDVDGNTMDLNHQQKIEIGKSLPLIASEGKGDEVLRTHLLRKYVWNDLCKGTQMIAEVIVPYTFRHLYAKAFHAGGMPLTNISSDIDHTTEVHHQSYARFIPDGTADLYTKRNARVA